MSTAFPSIDPKVLARRERQARYRAKFTDADKARRTTLQRDWYAKNRAKAMLIASRARAKAKGWEHNITLEDIIIPEVCPALGIAMDSASLDRHDNAKGYVKGNVRVISTRANSLKSDATREEIAAILAYMSTT